MALRNANPEMALPQALARVNDWWCSSPWQPYYLHWDDLDQWPNPWQLLDENVFCDVARGLGIVYTLLLISRSDIHDVALVESDQGNLVQVNSGKYILNYDKGRLLNIASNSMTIRRAVSGERIKNLIG